MSPFDLRVFVLINGVMACLMAGVLYAQARSYPPSIRGLRGWALAQLCAFFSTVLAGLQGTAPPWMGMGLSNTLLILAGGLLLAGTREHLGRPLSARVLLWLVLLVLPVMVALSGLGPTLYLYRLLTVTVLLALLFGTHAWFLWRHAPGTFGSRFMLVVLLALTAAMVMRCLTAAYATPPTGVFAPSPLQAAYLASFSLGLLLLAIGGILMATEHLRQELEHLASHDGLTGALNRRALFDLGHNEVARCRRLGSELSVLMMDLDHFKQVNDRHGHTVGDQVLRDFAHRVRAMLRRPAVLARYGGEEFVVVLPDTGAEAARRVAERLRASRPAEGLPACAVSIGLATLSGGGREDFGHLLDRADAALYQAKAAGRDRVEEAILVPA
jgi:diguanylate cyclase (GGDEF)-like protein